MSHPTPGLGQRSHLVHRELDELARGLPHPFIPARVLAQHSDRWLVAEPASGGSDASPGSDSHRAEESGGTDAGRSLPPKLVTARGRVRDQEAGPPVTGDWVALDEGGAIAFVLERQGTITRRAAGVETRAQVLASGVDLALIVEPAGAVNVRRAERFAALASAGGVDAAVVVTKADQDPDAYLAAAQLARELGLVDGFAVSAVTGEGVASMASTLTPGRTAVLLGPSGAGKSTLANALLGEDRMATGAVRATDGRGRHTTVTRELLPLPSGALLLDTPGMREIGLWDGGAGGAYADLEALAADCRFADCAHDGEPGCAVEPVIDPQRLAAWRKLAREQAWVDDRRAATREREALGRHYSRLQKRARSAKGNDAR